MVGMVRQLDDINGDSRRRNTEFGQVVIGAQCRIREEQNQQNRDHRVHGNFPFVGHNPVYGLRVCSAGKVFIA